MQNLAVWLNDAEGIFCPCLRMRHHTSARHTRCSDTDGKLHPHHLPSFLYEKREEQAVELLGQKGRKEFDFQMSQQNVKMKKKKKNPLPSFFDYIRFLSQIHPLSFPYFPFVSLFFLN
jgi:hypothetical protein